MHVNLGLDTKPPPLQHNHLAPRLGTTQQHILPTVLSPEGITTMSSIGPQLPPHLQKRKRTPDDDASPDSPPSKAMRPTNSDEIALDDDSSSDDGYGPSAG